MEVEAPVAVQVLGVGEAPPARAQPARKSPLGFIWASFSNFLQPISNHQVRRNAVFASSFTTFRLGYRARCGNLALRACHRASIKFGVLEHQEKGGVRAHLTSFVPAELILLERVLVTDELEMAHDEGLKCTQ